MSKADDLKQIAQLRKAIAPLVEILKAENETAVTERLDKIEKMLDGIKIEVAAPEVTLKAPDVVFDLKGFEKLLKTEFSSLKKSETPPAQPTALSDYRPHDQDENGKNNYYGFVSPDGDWYIMASQGESQRYAFGKRNYEAAWNKRGGQIYDYIDNAILKD